MVLKKVPRRIPKIQGGGVKAIWTFSKQNEIFLRDGFPKTGSAVECVCLPEAIDAPKDYRRSWRRPWQIYDVFTSIREINGNLRKSEEILVFIAALLGGGTQRDCPPRGFHLATDKTAVHCTLLYCTAMYCTALLSYVFHCTFHRTALHCRAQLREDLKPVVNCPCYGGIGR